MSHARDGIPSEPIGLAARLVIAALAIAMLGSAIALRWHEGERRHPGGIRAEGAKPGDYRPIEAER